MSKSNIDFAVWYLNTLNKYCNYYKNNYKVTDVKTIISPINFLFNIDSIIM